MDERRRRLLRDLAAAGLLGPAGVAGLIGEALAAGVTPGIRQQKGAVLINDRPAKPGQKVRPGDTVITAPDAEVAYVIGKDAFLQRGGATVAFGASAETFMRVVTGRILSVFGKSQRERTLRVSTATIGIRGTGCYIEDEGHGATARTYFCLCYGSVELTPKAAPQERERYQTDHHDHPLYIYNDMAMPKMMVPAKVINHTDTELTLLESLVARKPPFWGKDFPPYVD